MRILQYNIWNGCREPERFDRLDRWIAKQNYDVIGFNELKGWDKQELMSCAHKWGYTFYTLFETIRSKHYIGVISKYPIQVIETMEKPFHHGLLHVLINDVHFFLTHLSPRSSVAREIEANELAERASKIVEPLLIMGDLNTLSPLDQQYYQDMNLLDIVNREDALFNKFGSNGELNYEPMRVLLSSGLVDAGFSSSFQNSVPTHINLDKMHAAKMRIDYVLVNKKLLELNPIARILQNEQLDHLSDHYPIVCEWS